MESWAAWWSAVEGVNVKAMLQLAPGKTVVPQLLV
jgi:hypothetical protein